MPYTPPAAGSPSASYHNSPPRSPGPRVQLPRSNSSSSYLSRHRRSPSFQDHSLEKSGYFPVQHDGRNTSVRQSPQPMTTDSQMPVGAIISPPDSGQNSSDDDEPNRQTSRQVDGLEELTEAVRSIESDRTPASPPHDQSGSFPRRDLRLQLPDLASRVSTTTSEHTAAPPRPLSPSARKISHSRSTTEGSILDTRATKSAGASRAGSDDSDDDDDDEEGDSSSSGLEKPPLLRKKSGEPVKPAIRPPSRRRKHSSMPGTPTFSKAVHFNDDIEQVRHFLQVDRPIAVSAGTSPVDGHDDETEFPFGQHPGLEYEWEIRLSNFPRESFERLSSPVRLERLYLSADQKCLIGVVAVANLAFHKTVATRFTLDYWKTTSEVLCEYNNDIRQKPRDDGYDQFHFSIKLTDLVNLESKTLFICIRYQVNNKEYWDNNNSTNYQVDFVKKPKGAEAKTAPPNNTSKPIPRSRHHSHSHRPRSMPSFDDDFAIADETSSIKLKNPASSKADLSDNLFQRKQAPSGQQFGSRYDFGASLSAALVQAQEQISARSRTSRRDVNAEKNTASNRSSRDQAPKTLNIPAARTEELSRTGYIPPSNSTVNSPRPDALLANNQSFDSRAYQDFVSRFCFFGSSKSSTNQYSGAKSQQHRGNIDGTAEETSSPSDYSPESPDSNGGTSPVQEQEMNAPLQRANDQNSGTSSPLPVAGTGPSDRAGSPVAFGYPFTSDSRSGSFTPETCVPPTAIQG